MPMKEGPQCPDLVGGAPAGIKFTGTPAEAVKTAEATVATATEQASAERARGGCRELCRQREGEERDARAALLLAQQNRAATVKAAELDAQIATAEGAFNAVDMRAAHEERELEAIVDAIEACEVIRWPEGKIPGGKG
jgi:hypothetical protein